MQDMKGFMSAMRSAPKAGMPAKKEDMPAAGKKGDDPELMAAYKSGIRMMMDGAKKDDMEAAMRGFKIAFRACDMMPHEEYESEGK